MKNIAIAVLLSALCGFVCVKSMAIVQVGCDDGSSIPIQINSESTQIQSQIGCQVTVTENKTVSINQTQHGDSTWCSETIISEDGTQTQIQTGRKCQTQTSKNGTQTQTQCSGADCALFTTFPPLFTMQTMQPMDPMDPMDPMEPMQPLEPMKPMQPMDPMEPMQPMKPIEWSTIEE